MTGTNSCVNRDNDENNGTMVLQEQCCKRQARRIRRINKISMLPDLFGIAQLNVCSLFNKLGISFQKVDAPAGVFFQAIKLILKHKKKMFSSLHIL